MGKPMASPSTAAAAETQSELVIAIAVLPVNAWRR